MKLLICLGLLAASFSAFSVETCTVGYTCENATNGDFIVRETSIVNDHNQNYCQVITIENYGLDENTCDFIASEKNQSMKKN